jgi:Uma2 family endonuclease
MRFPKEPTMCVTEEDYLETEFNAKYKSEWKDGEVRAMGYAQPAHNLIISNVISALGNCLKKKNYRIYPSKLFVHVAKCKLYTYPDVTVVCGTPIYKQYRGKMLALTNPTVIFEVLSDSTEDYDRGEKGDCYKTIDTLQQYVLVSQKRKRVELHSRRSSNEWLLSDYTDESASLTIADCTLTFADIYDQIDYDQLDDAIELNGSRELN